MKSLTFVLLIICFQSSGQTTLEMLIRGAEYCALQIDPRKIALNEEAKTLLQLESIRSAVVSHKCGVKLFYHKISANDSLLFIRSNMAMDLKYDAPTDIFSALVQKVKATKNLHEFREVFKGGAIIALSKNHSGLTIIFFNSCADIDAFKKLIAAAKQDKAFCKGMAILCSVDKRDIVFWENY